MTKKYARRGWLAWTKACGLLLAAVVGAATTLPKVSANTTKMPKARACKVGAIVLDPDPAGLNVRSEPKSGKIVGQLPTGTQVTLSESRDRWVRVGDAWNDDQENRHDWPEGWVFSGLLTTYLKTPEEHGPATIPKLRKYPTNSSLSTPIDWRAKPTIEVMGCEGEFLDVVIKSGRSKQRGYLGWDSHCPNKVTTCS